MLEAVVFNVFVTVPTLYVKIIQILLILGQVEQEGLHWQSDPHESEV